jgi:hypothetical protein
VQADLASVARCQREHPLAFWWALALLLAVLSGVLWPTVPSYDPFSWIVWGREVTDPHLSFYVGNGPSWKPLPFFFTSIYGAFGGIAPALWVVTERVGAIAGLFGAFRLSALLCRRAGLPGWSGAVAGAVAIAGIVLSDPGSPWAYYFFRGASEPILIAVWLWAIDRLLAGRHLTAYLLLTAEGLMRPEAWPFLLGYGIWLWLHRPELRWWVIGGLVLQPAGWFGPPWISTGQPFLAATHAADYNGQLGANPLATVLKRGESLQPLPSLGLAVVATVLALWRGRDRVVLGLAAATAAWWVIVVGMTEDGYPGLQRFFLPAAAMICVLAGLGLVQLSAVVAELVVDDVGRLLTRAGGLLASVGRSLVGGRVAIAVLVGVLLLALSGTYVGRRWRYAQAQEPLAATAVTRIDDLGVAIRRLGGTRALLPCGSSVVTINHSLQTALAWKLGTTLARVDTVLTRPGIAFVGPRDTIDGGVPPVLFHFSAHEIAHVGAWSIQVVTRRGQPVPACVGR